MLIVIFEDGYAASTWNAWSLPCEYWLCVLVAFAIYDVTWGILQIMASSLNGLTVGDSLPDNIVDSPSRSENMLYIRWWTFYYFARRKITQILSNFCFSFYVENYFLIPTLIQLQWLLKVWNDTLTLSLCSKYKSFIKLYVHDSPLACDCV